MVFFFRYDGYFFPQRRRVFFPTTMVFFFPLQRIFFPATTTGIVPVGDANRRYAASHPYRVRKNWISGGIRAMARVLSPLRLVFFPATRVCFSRYDGYFFPQRRRVSSPLGTL